MKTRASTAFCLYLILLVSQGFSKILVYTYYAQNTAFYSCLKRSGMDQVSLWLESTASGYLPETVQNLINAKNAGLSVQAAMNPCRSRSAEAELQLLKSKIGIETVDRYWIVPTYDSDPICSWIRYTPEQNCLYLQQFISVGRSLGLNIQIAADRNSWQYVFQSKTACQEVSNSLLWWAPVDEQSDGQPNFNSYHQIGGWKKPYMKLYNESVICGFQVLLSYYE